MTDLVATEATETAGEQFTPREVLRVMVNLLLAEADQALSNLAW